MGARNTSVVTDRGAGIGAGTPPQAPGERVRSSGGSAASRLRSGYLRSKIKALKKLSYRKIKYSNKIVI